MLNVGTGKQTKNEKKSTIDIVGTLCVRGSVKIICPWSLLCQVLTPPDCFDLAFHKLSTPRSVRHILDTAR